MRMPVRSSASEARLRLFASLISRQRARNAGSCVSGSSRRSCRQVLDPARADVLRDEIGKQRIGERHPTARRDAVGLVAELLRPQLVEILENVALQKLGVQCGHAIDGMAADAGQVCHAHIALVGLLDDRHAPDALVVAQKAHPHLLEELRVDVVDDLQVPRQHAAEYLERPPLERLGEERVVGVGERSAGDVPCLVPGQGVLIDQEPHELGDGDCRMRIVQLRRELLMKALERHVLRARDAEHVLDRAGDEEVLLLETQLLAAQLFVIRIEHLAQVLRGDFLIHGAVIVAAVEGGEVERLGRLRAPQAQGVRGVGAIAQDERVVGNPMHDLVRNPSHARPLVLVDVVLGGAAEFNVHGPLGPRQLPGVAESQPFVGFLDLPAVDDLLLEDPELVANAVPERGNLERCHRIDEARRQSTETAAPEPRLLFLPQQLLEIEPELRHALPNGLGDAEIQQVVAEMRPHQELGG